MLHFNLLEKQEPAKPKSSRHKAIIMIRTAINEIETRRKYVNQSISSLKR
jgi:hypothetical protein